MKKLLYIVAPLLALILAWIGYSRFFKDSDIHIAVVVPSLEKGSVGESFLNGIDLYIEEINSRNGVDGKKIRLDKYEDNNDPDTAWRVANQIADKNRAVAVIGHYYSSCSIRAGEVYRENGIPAITPASTNVHVTKNNDWYFRSTFNDDLQGRFLAHYAAEVFDLKNVSIIYENREYGSYIASVFEKTMIELGVPVKYKWSFDNKGNVNVSLKEIAWDLAQKDDAGLVLLATHAPEGVKLLNFIKSYDAPNPLIAPDAYSSDSFQKGVREIENKKRRPGFLTDDMYVITPWNTDTTNEIGQRFKEDYQRSYGVHPDWHAAFSYDTAMVVVRAVQKSGIQAVSQKIVEDRIRIRDYLAHMDEPYDAVKGVTGDNYFDENGDSKKPVYIGVYKKQNLISALTQFRTIPNVHEIVNLNQALETGAIVKFGGRYSYKINLAYTGVQLLEIKDMDPASFDCTMEFYLWFRHGKDIDVHEIEFLNAKEPISLNEPVREKIQGQLKYVLYKIKGRFRADFLPDFFVFGNHLLGFNFRHKKMDRNNLVFVKDVLGMHLDESDMSFEQIKKSKVMATVAGWRIKQVDMFRDVSENSSLGDPEYFHVKEGILEFSRFNAVVRITEEQVTFRYSIHHKTLALVLTLLAFIVEFALELFVRGRFLKPYSKPLWFVQFFFAAMFLISAECYIIEKLSYAYSANMLNSIIRVFDVLWWLVPAYFITQGIDRFIWTPVEERSGRTIPHIIKGLLSFLIYLLAIFGVVAFVYHQALTSLLATSGVIAMIIGLAVQINISNIFSGIAINLERPFRIGDWVKIGSFNEGKIIDINWRTTRIHTRDDTVLSIPNSQASESSIENFSYPNDSYFKYFTIHVDPHHPPERVKRVLLNAAISTEGVLDDPPPATRFLGLTAGMTGLSTDWAANYLIGVKVRDYGKKFAHNEAVWTSVWSHLKLAGIKHVMERHEIDMTFQGIKPKRKKLDSKVGILQDIDIFQLFSDEDKAYLAEKMRKHEFPQGQMVVQQGAAGDSLFVIVEGALGVWVRTEGKKSVEVARLGAGSFFGEMALLTGEPRAATIIAITETCLYEITKDDISPLIKEHPELFAPLSEVLSKRKLDTEYHTARQETVKEDENNLAAQILGKIQNFFGF